MWENFQDNFWDLSSKLNTYDRETVLNNKEAPNWIYCLYGIHEEATSGIVYIGRSTQPKKRIEQHYKDNNKEFAYYNVLPIQTRIPSIDEALYIAKYDPPYNKEIPQNPIIVPFNKYVALYPGTNDMATNYMEKKEIWETHYNNTYVNMIKFYQSILGNLQDDKGINKIKKGD